jgi:hypothetical protein
MSQHSRRSTARGSLALALGGAILMLVVGASGALAQGSGSAASPGPDEPVVGSPIPTEPTVIDGGAIPAVPDDRVVDPHPSAWDHVTIAADGRTMTVYFWNGVEACYGLHHVDVAIGADGLPVVTVFTGSLPIPVGTACIEIAQLYSTIVTLDSPIIHDGSAPAA